jgi:hypothetical protein
MIVTYTYFHRSLIFKFEVGAYSSKGRLFIASDSDKVAFCTTKLVVTVKKVL